MRYLLMMLALVLAGCSTTGEYRDYLTATHEGHKLALQNQKPLVEIEAAEGQVITGLKAVRVYTPVSAPVVQQARPNEWAGVANNALGVIGSLGGVYLGGKAAEGLATAVGSAATAGYGYIQAPGAVTTTTIGANSGANSGNSGRLAGGDVTDSTHAPTVVEQPAPVIVTQPAPVVVTP